MRPDSSPREGPRPEVEALICAGQVGCESEKAARLWRLLQGEFDWDYLLSLARPHGMLPLLYRSVQTTCADAVTGDILDQLREHFQRTTQRNLFLTGELLKILGLFTAHQVSAIPFKGPTLAALAYGDVGLREFSDLDILIRKQDVSRAKELLVSCGYQPQVTLTAAQEAAFLRSENALLFSRDDIQSIVELHWELTPRYLSSRLDQNHLWERLELTSPAGQGIFTLAPEHLLHFLCVHGAKHGWDCLGWICDVARLVNAHRGLDWGLVLAQARKQGDERMLLVGLSLAGDLLGAAVPATVSEAIEADSVAKALARMIYQRYLYSPDRPQGIVELGLFHLKAKERLRDKVRYCLHALITPSVADWEFLPLPGALSFLYFLLRPIRLLRKMGPSEPRRRT